MQESIGLVVPLPKSLVFLELAKALQEALSALKVLSEILVEPPDSYEFDDDRTYIIYGVEILPVLPIRFIVYQFEQMWAKIDTVSTETMEDYVMRINKAMCLWEYSKPNIAYFQQHGVTVPIYYVPLGYSPCMERNAKTTYAIDAIFIGNVPESEQQHRRHRILANIPNVQVFNNRVYDNDDPRLGPTVSHKTDLLASAKVATVIYYYPPTVSSFDLYRIVSFIASKTLVISEHSMDQELNRVFQPHIDQCEWMYFADRISFYASHPNLRDEKVAAAYEWLTSNFRYERFIPPIPSVSTPRRSGRIRARACATRE